MINSHNKIPVGILGATGSVGQKFVELLENHPWFEITALAASEHSSNRPYREAVNWFMQTPIPANVAQMPVQCCDPVLDCQVVFSGLDSSVAGEIETKFAEVGYIIISNSKNHRFDTDVPLLIPEVNSDHLELVKHQKYGKGMIITNPNCSTIGLVIALKPLIDSFGLKSVNIVTMQALSGAGYPGVSALDCVDNVLPFISGEEEKIETEPLKILGKYENVRIKNINLEISAQCNRVPVIDGHLECVSVKLKTKATPDDIKQSWIEFTSEPQHLNLPFAPQNPIHYFEDDHFPQPKLHRNIDKGMAVSIGRLRKCNILDYKFVLLSHNTIRGAAGGAILNAELMKAKDYF